MQDADLEGSKVVEAVTWTLYLGWISGMAAIALYLGVEPLPTVRETFPGPAGTLAALTVGVLFVLASRWVYDRLRARFSTDSEAKSVPEATADPADTQHTHRKKSKKKKRMKKKRRR